MEGEELRARIAEGELLRVQPVDSFERLEAVRADYRAWEESCFMLLLERYPDRTWTGEFRGFSFGREDNYSLEAATRELHRELAVKLTRLRSVGSRMSPHAVRASPSLRFLRSARAVLRPWAFRLLGAGSGLVAACSLAVWNPWRLLVLDRPAVWWCTAAVGLVTVFVAGILLAREHQWIAALAIVVGLIGVGMALLAPLALAGLNDEDRVLEEQRFRGAGSRLLIRREKLFGSDSYVTIELRSGRGLLSRYRDVGWRLSPPDGWRPELRGDEVLLRLDGGGACRYRFDAGDLDLVLLDGQAGKCPD